MRNFNHALVRTAGAYVAFNELYVFTIGWKPHNGNIPVVRLGGHVEAGEGGWGCAAREVAEEANIRITPIDTRRTFLICGEDPDLSLAEIDWSEAVKPLLVVAYPSENQPLLSLMYLAQCNQMPEPSSEVKGILLLDPERMERICEGTLTLNQYLKQGGKAILRHDFDLNMRLEPFIQLRIFAKLLKTRLI